MSEELEYNDLAEIDGWWPTETNPQGTGIFLSRNWKTRA